MDRHEHYQDLAAQCLRMAQSTDDPTRKALFLQMAQVWANFADQVRDSEIEALPADRESK